MRAGRVWIAAIGTVVGAAAGWSVGHALGFQHVLLAAVVGAATPFGFWLYRAGRKGSGDSPA